MVEFRLAVDVRRHLLAVDLILFLVHFHLVLRSNLLDPWSGLLVPGSNLLGSGLTGTTSAGTDLSIELTCIDHSCHRYREDKG